MRKWPFVLLGAAVVLVGGAYIYRAMHKVDDRTQIQMALKEAIQASKDGKPGGVVDKLAENFKLNDMQAGMQQVAKFIENNHPEVEVADMEPVISGDTAQINSDVTVKVTFLNSMDVKFKSAVIQFKKESAMEWLIFPTEKWKLSAARVKPEDLPSIPTQ